MERAERINTFVDLALSQLTKESVDIVYNLIVKYDLPKTADREFVYDCLIQYYSSIEEYEICAELLKLKNQVTRKKRITSKKLTIIDIENLEALGFEISDDIKLKVIKNTISKQGLPFLYI